MAKWTGRVSQRLAGYPDALGEIVLRILVNSVVLCVHVVRGPASFFFIRVSGVITN